MAAVHEFENVVTAVSEVSCNIVQLRYAVFFFGGGNRYRGRTMYMVKKPKHTWKEIRQVR